MMISSDFPTIADKLQPGDTLAFGGGSSISKVIKWVTRSAVSHNGIVTSKGLAESNFDTGVAIRPIADRIAEYDGRVWWLPLSNVVRMRMNVEVLESWVHDQVGKPYDVAQAVEAGLDMIGGAVIHAREDFGRLFCSELAAGALEASGAVGKLDASEVTPVDLCMFQVYTPDYYQIKGPAKIIRGFNSVSPDDWGQ